MVPWSQDAKSNSVSPVDSTACGHRWSMMKHEQRLQVEVYSHGGWWKASNGLTGQVPVAQAGKSPMATVASVANTFGTGGWRLTDLVSAHHNTYLLSFEAADASAATSGKRDQRNGPAARPTVTTTLG